ncbi:aspartic peptidase domain-containing protein [Ampelomyces quisqualis]|uniref:Aspartic peptidase domain-containing protein n=1 Tax=Ampelomyces quisqualis TaxID=50730 RepID=A0A6A5QG48_AMPQU|nr:aspartic peptidase domain-containing protein [Ampelomyces quisqualis]
MRLLLFANSLLAYSITAATSSSIAPRDNITDNVLGITADDYPDGTSSPSSVHSAHRRANSLRKREILQYDPSEEELPTAIVRMDVSRRGPHYITKVAFGEKLFSLVIDIETPATWIARTGFRCFEPRLLSELPPQDCRLGRLFKPDSSSSSFNLPGPQFSVHSINGQNLLGDPGSVSLGLGGLHRGEKTITFTQIVGAITKGYWPGDGKSSGSLGLAYYSKRGMLSGSHVYRSVLENIFGDENVPAIFSLALDGGTGGDLGIGGIPRIPIDDDSPWVQTALIPSGLDEAPTYDIMIDGFDITPHPRSSSGSAGNRYIPWPQITKLRTNTGFLHLPDKVVSYIADLFDPPAVPSPRSENIYIVPCRAKAPRVGIKISSTSYYISPQDLIQPIDVRKPNDKCQLMIQKAGNGKPALGGAWLNNVLAVFDLRDSVDHERPERNGYRSGRMWFVGREKT